MTTVKLSCGRCGSEGEFPVHAGTYNQITTNTHAIYADWVKAHAPCLAASSAHEAWKAEPLCPQCIAAKYGDAPDMLPHHPACGAGVDAASEPITQRRNHKTDV